jgi:hypothetical protein
MKKKSEMIKLISTYVKKKLFRRFCHRKIISTFHFFTSVWRNIDTDAKHNTDSDSDTSVNVNKMYIQEVFFFEEAKLVHSNWYQRESNLRPWGGAHSPVPSQYH